MMRLHLPILFFLGVATSVAAGFHTAQGAELKILEPADKSVVRGQIQFRVKPEDAPTDLFFANPEVAIQDEYGRDLQKLTAIRDPKTGICATPTLDTRRLRDGLYLVVISYRTLFRGMTLQITREDLTLAVRNGPARPTRFRVDLQARPVKTGEACDFTVKVVDQGGRPMPGARVGLKVSQGSVTTDVEMTDSQGEVSASLDAVGAEDADRAGGAARATDVTLTVSVENLPPVRKIVHFGAG